MGRSRKAPTPPPPKAAPPPVQEVTAELIAPTMQQEVARRQRRGAYATRGQTLGASGEVLGASPMELANVRQATGVTGEKKLSLNEYKKQTNLGNLDKFKGRRNKARLGMTQNKMYQDYLKRFNKEQTPISTKGQMI